MTISSSDCAIRSGVAPDHVSLENFAKNPLSLVKSTCSPASSHRYFLQKNLKLLSNQPAVQLLGSKKFAKKKPLSFNEINSSCWFSFLRRTLEIQLSQTTIIPFVTYTRATLYVQFEYHSMLKSKVVQYKIW